MENVMNRRKGKRKMVVIGIIVLIFIVLVIFLKMKYGTYGLHDFNCFFRQSKQEILEKMGSLLTGKNYMEIARILNLKI